MDYPSSHVLGSLSLGGGRSKPLEFDQLDSTGSEARLQKPENYVVQAALAKNVGSFFFLKGGVYGHVSFGGVKRGIPCNVNIRS